MSYSNILVPSLIITWLFCHIDASVADEQPGVPPIVVELKLPAGFDPADPKGNMTCIVHNKTDHGIVVPKGFHADAIVVYGQAQLGSNPNATESKWPLKLHGRTEAKGSRVTARLEPGKSLTIFQLPLKDLLARPDVRPFRSGNSKINAKQETNVKPADSSQAWSWDWIAHPHPPASPIHAKDGSVNDAEFWVEIKIGQTLIDSKRQLLKIRKIVPLKKLIWETTGGGDLKFDVTAKNDNSCLTPQLSGQRCSASAHCEEWETARTDEAHFFTDSADSQSPVHGHSHRRHLDDDHADQCRWEEGNHQTRDAVEGSSASHF